jgi:hypothetical protein
VCYPFLVTIVFWAVLYTGPWFLAQVNAWSNISEHAMNSLFALFEVIIPRTNPMLWIHILWLIIILACYLGLAYLTHSTRGIYVYGFLDPAGGKGKLAGYVLGIAVGIIVIFVIVKGLIWLRRWVTETKLHKEGKFHAGRSKEQGDVELDAGRRWASAT